MQVLNLVNMKRLLLFILLVALSFPQVLKAQNETKPFVHCIVLDKTKSMIGKDGTKAGTTNIWNEVQDYCCGMIDGFMPSSTVLLYTFDKELFGPDVFVIRDEADKTSIKSKVRNITVDGQKTWIASNLGKVIESVYSQYKDCNIMIYLLTDGIEEQPGCGIEEVINAYGGYTGDYDHLYYVDLRGLLRNSTSPCAKEFKDGFEKGEHLDIVDGYPKIVMMSPLINPVVHVIKDESLDDKEFEATQIFQVTSGKLTEDFSFEVFVPGGNVDGLNLDISPSRITVNHMNKINDEGKYSIQLKVKIVNNASLKECVIPVSLKGCKGENTLSFEPSRFTIETKMHVPVVHDTIHKTHYQYDTIPVIIKEVPKMETPVGWE